MGVWLSFTLQNKVEAASGAECSQWQRGSRTGKNQSRVHYRAFHNCFGCFGCVVRLGCGAWL